jgi:hypothetical protein
MPGLRFLILPSSVGLCAQDLPQGELQASTDESSNQDPGDGSDDWDWVRA